MLLPRNAASFLLLVICPLASYASEFDFTGAVNSEWNNPANWAQGAIPGPSDDAIISDSTMVTLSSNISIADISLEDYGTLNVNNYTLSVSDVLENNGGILNGGGTVLFSGPGVDLQNYGLIFSNPKTFTLQTTGSGSLDIAGTNGTITGLIESGPYWLGNGTEATLNINAPVLPIAGGIGLNGPMNFTSPLTLLSTSSLSFEIHNGNPILTAPSVEIGGKVSGDLYFDGWDAIYNGSIAAAATIDPTAKLQGNVTFDKSAVINGGSFTGGEFDGLILGQATVTADTTFNDDISGTFTVNPGVTVDFVGSQDVFSPASSGGDHSITLEHNASLVVSPSNSSIQTNAAFEGSITMYDGATASGSLIQCSVHVASGTGTISAPFASNDNGQSIRVDSGAQLVFTNTVSLSTWPNLPTMNFGSGITRFDCGTSGLSLYGNFDMPLLDLDGTSQNPTALIVNQAPDDATVTTLTTNSVDVDDGSYDGLMEIGNGATFKLITPTAWTLGPTGSIHFSSSLIYTSPQSSLAGSDILAKGTFESAGFKNQILSNLTCDGATFDVNAVTLQVVNNFDIATTATKMGPGNLDIAGPQSHAIGAQFISSGGNAIFDTDAGAIASNLSIVANQTGTITLDVRQHLNSVTVSGSGLVQPNPGYYGDKLVLTTNGLSIADNGRLDLQDTGMIWNLPPGTDPTPTLLAVRSLIASAYANGAWTGPGITTSFARKFPYQLTTIAYVTGAQLGQSFYANEPLAANSILIAGAFIGDANLDDNVDDADAAIVWNSIQNPPAVADWADGDFNFDGVVNEQDMLLLDRTLITFNDYRVDPSFYALRTDQFGPDYVPMLMAMLPEPAALVLALLLIAFSRRRFPRRNAHAVACRTGRFKRA